MPRWEGTLEEKVLAHIEKTGDCWNWTGYRDRHGYGAYNRQRAHRLAYELWVGPIPAGMTIDHLCRNRRCCNPQHLEPVPNKTNCLRGESFAAHNARKTHCKRGHEFTPENTITYQYPNQIQRICRTCRAIRSKKEQAA